MRYLLSLFVLAFALSIPASSQNAGVPSAMLSDDKALLKTEPDTFKAVEQYFNNTNSLQSDFIQTNADGSRIRGSLSLERPGKIRFDYGADATLLVVSDGETLNLVDYEVGQVKRWPVNDTPLKILLNHTIDLRAMDAVIRSHMVDGQEKIEVVTRDPESSEHYEITLYFTKNNGLDLILNGWDVVDTKHQTTTVKLFNNSINNPLSSELWTFEDPRGLAKRKRSRR